MADSSKTEKATPKKKSDERKKGNIFQSRDITSAFALLLIFAALRLTAPYFYTYLKNLIIDFAGTASSVTSINDSGAARYFTEIMLNVVLLSLPVALIASIAAIVFGLAQTRFLFSFEAVKMKLSRISLFGGVKRLFSIRSLVELVKSIIKIVLIVFVIYTEIKALLVNIISLMKFEIEQSIFWLCESIFGIVIKISLVMIAFGIFDYFYQWWEYEKQLRMTKQEIKEEFKMTEGDPQVKGRIKQMQQKMSRMRMMQNVPSADVVIRNPTHYAVAIKYDHENGRAPVVVAKGSDYIAFKIIEIAEKNDVYITENRPLAKGLYEASEVGMEIPIQFYTAVAEVLAFFYSLKKKDRSRR